MFRRFSINFEEVKKFLDPRQHDKNAKNTFVFNIILGVTIILLFSVELKDIRPKQDTINWYFDQYTLWRMDSDENSFIDKYILFQKAADMETKRIAKNLMFLDFDNDAVKSLERPTLTPRDKVADLVQTAYQGGAAIIVIDMNFAEQDFSHEKLLAGDKTALTGEQRDKILYDLLKKIRDDETSDTKILLPRTNYADRSERQNIFSDLIDGKKIFAVTPMFTERGSNVRFWVPYLKSENVETGENYILWSIPIMTMALTIGNVEELHTLEEKILNDSDDDRNKYFLNVERNGVTEKFPIYEEIYSGGGVQRDTKASQYNRIQYVLFPSGVKSSKPISGNIDESNLRHWRRNGIDQENFDCKNKIVVVGRADDDCDDFLFTPGGMMPGMYVHANAIATVLSSSRPHLCSTTTHVVIEFLLVLIAAYVFLNFSGSKIGYTILFMFGACWVLPFFYYCFTNEYIFLNMAFMSLGFYNASKVMENLSWKGVSKLSNFLSILERR